MDKLLMITGDRSLYLGKQGAFFSTLSELHKHFERIDIICPGPSKSSDNIQLFGNVFVYPSPRKIWYQPFFIAKKGLELYKKNRFGIFTVHEYAPFYNGIGAWLLWRRIKTPYLLEIMHIPGYPKASSFREVIYYFMAHIFLRFTAKRARAVRVINKTEMPKLLKSFGIPEKKIVLIGAMYIDLAVFYPIQEQKKYDLIFVGRLATNKGLDIFLDAIKNSKLSAIIVGDGPMRDMVADAAKDEELHGRLAVHGWAKDAGEVSRLINQSKLLVMPSLNEGGPRVVLESMACGVPVLATPVGIVPDVVVPSETGDIIKWDGASIINKAEKILADDAIYSLYSRNCINMAARYEKTGAISNYAEKIKSLIRK